MRFSTLAIAASLTLLACTPRAPGEARPRTSTGHEASGRTSTDAGMDAASIDAASIDAASIDAASIDAASTTDAAATDARAAADASTDASTTGAARPLRASCEPERLGGWDGTAACRATAQRPIPGAHRRCDTSADCVLFGPSCDEHAVHQRYAARYERSHICTPPGRGSCGMRARAVCEAGCCYASTLGF